MTDSATADRSIPAASGIDGLAIKPTEVEVDALAAGRLPGASEASGVETLVVDFEGEESVPDAAVLERLAERTACLRVTTPVRADGFDPLGDASESAALPDAVDRIFVAGHPAYLEDHERQRATAPRLRAAVAAADDPWVGTEGIERAALALDATQFELLSPTIERDVRSLRATGYDGEIAVYAPTVLSADEDAILDSVGEYVARRDAVADALHAGVRTDASATGEAHQILSRAAREYALVGDVAAVRERTAALREAGVDRVVAYPAAGLASLLGR